MQAGIGLQEGGGAGEGRAATCCLPKVLWSFSPWKWAVVGEGARKEQRQPGVIETAAPWLWGPQTTSSNFLLKGWPPSHSRGPPESGTHSTSPSGHITFKRKKERRGGKPQWRFVAVCGFHPSGQQDWRAAGLEPSGLQGPGFQKGMAGRLAHGPGCPGSAGLPGQRNGEPRSSSRFWPQREASGNTGCVSSFWFCECPLNAPRESGTGLSLVRASALLLFTAAPGPPPREGHQGTEGGGNRRRSQCAKGGVWTHHPGRQNKHLGRQGAGCQPEGGGSELI